MKNYFAQKLAMLQRTDLDGLQLQQLYDQVIHDVSVCSALPGFPRHTARLLDMRVLDYRQRRAWKEEEWRRHRRQAGLETPDDMRPPQSLDEWRDALEGLFMGLNSIFSLVREIDPDGLRYRFDGDPLTPLRALAAVAEERRAQLAEDMKTWRG